MKRAVGLMLALWVACIGFGQSQAAIADLSGTWVLDLWLERSEFREPGTDGVRANALALSAGRSAPSRWRDSGQAIGMLGSTHGEIGAPAV
jgi:hypothetical protein